MADVQAGSEPQQTSLFDRIESAELGDNGYIEFKYAEPEPETPAEATPPAAAPVDTPKADPPPTDWEKRYKDLEREFTRKSQELAEVKRAPQAKPEPEAPKPAVNPLDLISDPDRFNEYVASHSKEEVAALRKELAPIIENRKFQNEINEVVGRNPDFWDYFPAVREIVAEVDMPFEAAYNIARRFFPNAGKKTDPPADEPPKADPPPSTKVPARAVAERAAALQTESGVSDASASAPARKITSIHDAFNAALEDAGR